MCRDPIFCFRHDLSTIIEAINMLPNKKFRFDIITHLSGALIMSSVLQAHAGTKEDIAAIQSKLDSRNPPVKVKSINTTPINGLYEIFNGSSIIYSDKSFSHVILGGSIIETTKNKNLTEESIKVLTAIKFSDLPLQNAIEIKKGNGAYKFAVFSDPDCPYCKELEISLDKSGATDYTAYLFLYPLKDLHPDSTAKSESIWCAMDKAEAWTNLMVKNIEPDKASCDNPINKNQSLADKLGVSGTPTVYLSNGQQSQNPQELIAEIKASNKKK